MVKGKGQGKVILFGEHFVVYGVPAIAAGLDLEIEVEIEIGVADAVEIDGELNDDVLSALGIIKQQWQIEQGINVRTVRSDLPVGAGLGSSAALGVAIARALDQELDLKKIDEQISSVVYETEKHFHGNPSGIDNAVATWGGLISFSKVEDHSAGGLVERFEAGSTFHLVIVASDQESSTKEMVEAVRWFKEKDEPAFSLLCQRCQAISFHAKQALTNGVLEKVGELMDENHLLLQQIGASTNQLDELVRLARQSGAAGAKLTGAGGGGCVIAACGGLSLAQQVQAEWENAGFNSFITTIG